MHFLCLLYASQVQLTFTFVFFSLLLCFLLTFCAAFMHFLEFLWTCMSLYVPNCVCTLICFSVFCVLVMYFFILSNSLEYLWLFLHTFSYCCTLLHTFYRTCILCILLHTFATCCESLSLSHLLALALVLAHESL